MFDTSLKLYNKVLNKIKIEIKVKIKINKIKKSNKKRIKVQNVPENLPFEFYIDGDELPLMSSLEDDKVVKLNPEELIAERIKLNPQKGKTAETELKILTPNKVLTWVPILLAQNAKNVYNNLIWKKKTWL